MTRMHRIEDAARLAMGDLSAGAMIGIAPRPVLRRPSLRLVLLAIVIVAVAAFALS